MISSRRRRWYCRYRLQLLLSNLLICCNGADNTNNDPLLAAKFSC